MVIGVPYMRVSQYDEIFLWPPKCCLSFYKRRTKFLFSETDRRTDLSDTLMFGGNYRTVYLGVSTKSVRWQRWDEDNLEKIEALIKYDITFDGDRVQITRLGKKGAPCSTEFLWRLQIRSA